MNVQFRLMRRSGDKAYVLSEIADYDVSYPVVLAASTETGVRIPSDTFPYCADGDYMALESVLHDASVAASDLHGSCIHTKTTADVRFFVIVLPWLNVKKWVLEFKAIDAAGNVVDSCVNRLDVGLHPLLNAITSRMKRVDGVAIENLDGRFIHDRIQLNFVRALARNDTYLISFMAEMPYHEESVIDFDFLDDTGSPIDLEYCIIEDSIARATGYGVADRRYMMVSFEVDKEDSMVCVCATDTVGNVAPGFSMLGEENLVELLADFAYKTGTAYYDPGYNDWFRNEHQVDFPTLLEQVSAQFEYEPLISLVCLLRDAPAHHVHDLMNSLTLQSYNRWELILINSEGNNYEVSDAINSFEDDRVYMLDMDSEQPLLDRVNAGLCAAEGDFIGILRASDTLSADALFECVRTVNEYNDCDFIYTDLDTVDADGVHSRPVFLPNYSPELLRSGNYIQGFMLLRSSLFDCDNLVLDGSSAALDYDLMLKVTERSRRVCHIPRVLLHVRYAARTEGNSLFYEFEQEAGRKALVEHCSRVGINAEVLNSPIARHYRLRHVLRKKPHVVIVIPSKDRGDLVLSCVRQIFNKVNYDNFEVVVVDMDSADSSALEAYALLDNRYEDFSLLHWEHEFNHAKIANYATTETAGDFYLYINDDTRFASEDVIETMLGYFQSDNVGVVGPRQLFVDGTVEHAGLVLGGSRIINPLARFMDPDWTGYLNLMAFPRNVTAVTGDCMMVRRSVFDEVAGFTESFASHYSDVDFCLKANDRGYYTVYTPYVNLSHSRSVSRVRDISKETRIVKTREAALLKSLWPSYFVEGDAFNNLNLNPNSPYFGLKY